MAIDNITISPTYKKIEGFEKLSEDIHRLFTNYPKTLIISGIALVALGICTGVLAGASLALAGAAIVTGVAYRWRHVLTYLFAVPLLHRLGVNVTKMDHHVFQERECLFNGKVVGKVFYSTDKDLGRDIPVLDIDSSVKDRYEMGFIHGYLLADKIEELAVDVLRPMIGSSQILVGDYRGYQLKEGLKKVQIPEKYMQELRGIYDGLQKYAKERDKPLSITLEDLMLAHQFADIYKSIGCQRILGIQAFSAVGCSTVVEKKEDSTNVERTLDWPTFIKGGQHMIVMRYTAANGTRMEIQTLPGIMHALTTKNQHNLIGIINELGMESVGGTPYGLVARDIMEQATTVEEAREMIVHKVVSDKDRPASSHTLTLADTKEASIFHFYVKKGQSFLERNISKPGTMIVTNHAIDGEGHDIPGTEADYSSHQRKEALTEALAAKATPQACLKAVNVVDTVAVALYSLKNNGEVSVKYGHGGNYAAETII